ncbi:MAG TPA: J domain-containing protein [Thermomicrobiales bacterium]|nr:J domain-containing protein [Thermomicrobiales bacterium]
MSTSRPRPRFDTSINYYQVLDVSPGASGEEITRAYRGLMRLTHPDNFSEPDQRAKAEERTKLINAAYTVLSKPDIRREYDNQMRATIVSDTLMQRYTGNTPGRRAPAQPGRRPPSAQTARAQRNANRSATLQILFVTGGFVACLIIVIVSVVVTYNALTSLV